MRVLPLPCKRLNLRVARMTTASGGLVSRLGVDGKIVSSINTKENFFFMTKEKVSVYRFLSSEESSDWTKI